MKKVRILVIIPLMLALSSFSGSYAHVPTSGNTSSDFENAVAISDPVKSWAVYGQLPSAQETQFYYFDISQEETIYVSLLLPVRADQPDFLPNLVIMSPELQDHAHEAGGNSHDHVDQQLPAYVTVPDGYSVTLVPGVMPEKATYEAFGPSAYYQIASFIAEAPVTGRYYIAVYEDSSSGYYGMAVGTAESFTITEIILTPLNIIYVYIWEGQNLLFILMPFLLTLAAGLTFIIKFGRQISIAEKTTALVGFSFIASSVSFIYQAFYSAINSELGPEIILSVFLAALPAALGSAILYLVSRKQLVTSTKNQLWLAIISFLGLFTWSGLIIGPVTGIGIFVVLQIERIRQERASKIVPSESADHCETC